MRCESADFIGPAAAVSAAVRSYIQQQPILYVKAGKKLPRKREAFITHMIAKEQMKYAGKIKPSAARQLYSLVMYAFLIILPSFITIALPRQNRENYRPFVRKDTRAGQIYLMKNMAMLC